MLNEKQMQIIIKAANLAHEANLDDESATVEYFINDYTEAMLSGNKEDLASLYFAISSLDLEAEAKELTELTEQEAEIILSQAHEEEVDNEKD